MRRRKKKLKSMSSLEAKLDKLFSKFIRLRDADEGGTVSCVTCGKLMHWKDAHAGHFVKRQHRSLRWDERNVHVQCASENVFRGGAQDEYAKFIIERYGLEVFNDLMAKKYEVKKHSRAELQEMIERYS
jgi:hypothetical protein